MPALLPLSGPAAGSTPTGHGEVERVAFTRDTLAAPVVVPPAGGGLNPAAEVRKLNLAEAARAERLREEAEAAKKAAEERAAAKKAAAKKAAAEKAAKAAAKKFVKPAEGRFTSGFGARWGTSHNGIDIANSIGTPIVSVAKGKVIEAGPASGFGLWVRVEHEDGTVTVYGHMNEILVSPGQQVKAGEKIATIGNRGQSTGPHLHFEVWQGGSNKVDPLSWLRSRGVSL
ncbi:MAG: M23 family metallopeptidase [Haloechinothrix sp.]